MAWTAAARKAAALARRAKALTHQTSPTPLTEGFKAVLYRSGPTNNPTGSGVRFAPKSSAKVYAFTGDTSRYLVKLKKPFRAEFVYDAAKKLGMIKDVSQHFDKLRAKDVRTKSLGKVFEDDWMKMDLQVKQKTAKLGHDGLVYTGQLGASRSPYHELEVVACKPRGQFRKLKWAPKG